MKLVTYQRSQASVDEAQAEFGVLTADGIISGGRLSNGRYISVRQVLEERALSLLSDAAAGLTPDIAVSEVILLPPVPNPGKILCAGINYRTHREETARPETAHPMLFTRFADTQIGHGAPALKPSVTQKFDYEGELAVVIAATADAVSVEDASAYVAGYACYNDFSARDWQRHTSQFLPGKNFKATGAFGPCLVTRDEIEDIGQCRLETIVNGDVRQSALIDDLIFSIEELISYISTFTTLHAGDVIVTGTPGGVGLFREPPEFLVAGDRVEVKITGVGHLINQIA